MSALPSFCRHNRLIQNCPICSREQSVEMRPVVSSAAPRVNPSRPAGGAGRDAPASRPRPATGSRGTRGGGGDLKVRRLVRGADDGYRCPLVRGLRSSLEADRLAQELAFGAGRLQRLAADPPGPYAEIAGSGDVEERTWLAFLIAYLCPLETDEPFVGIEAAHTTWASGELPDLSSVPTGPRTAHDPARGSQTVEAYRAWAARAGSQAAAFAGDAAWAPERRFDRVFERLALPGLHRDARYELLVLLGRLSVYDLRGGALHFSGASNETTVAAKRAFGIGDNLLLERRSRELAEACAVPLEALDLALYNWGCGQRAHLGLAADAEPDLEITARCRRALGL